MMAGVYPKGTLISALVIVTTALHAQGSWTPVTSTTTQHLWGSCHDGTGTFVLVGEGGTILTSPDGMTWTPRTSGTTVALRAVAHSPALLRFVTVGDAGTILTSPDAITWTARTSGTSAQLNGIAWGGDRFLAVGASGTARVSTDGLSWLVRGTGVTADLRGIAYGHGQFVIGGQVATLLATTDGTQFLRRGIITTGAVEALAFDGERFLAVGDGGLFVTATDPHHWSTDRGYFSNGESFRAAAFAVGNKFAAGTTGYSTEGFISSRPEQFNGALVSTTVNTLVTGNGVVVAAGQGGGIARLVPVPMFRVAITTAGISAFGQALTLLAEETGTPPFTYQWRRDFEPIAGATGATLEFSNLRVPDNGSYEVYASNATNPNRSSGLYQLAVSAVPPDGAAIDRRFDAGLPARVSVAVQDDGKLLVSGALFFYPDDEPQYGLARLNVDGSLDETFRLNQNPFNANNHATGITFQPDGSYIVSAVSHLAAPTSYRFLADGTWDQSYTSAPGIALANGGYVQIQITIGNSIATVTQLNPDGSALDSFPLELDTTPSSVTGAGGYFSGQVHVFDSQGRIVVAAVSYQSVGTGIFGINLSRLFRLLPDGSLDPTFAMVMVNDAITALWCHPQNSKIYYQANWRSGGLGSNHHTKFARLQADGTPDSTYVSRVFTDLLGRAQRTVSTFGRSADGSVLVTNDSLRDGSVVRIVQYDTDGVEDASFSAAVFDQSFGAQATLTSVEGIVPAADGGLYVLTNAPALNGLPRAYLARIYPATNDAGSRLTNLSIRTSAGTGSATLIAGFVVAGQGDKTMLIRGVGPSLAGFSVPNPLADPELTLFREQSATLTNNDWSNGPTAADVISRGATLGAFPLVAGSRDAAAIATLAPGLFTMHVRSADTATGIVLAEAYDADDAPADFAAPRVINFSARAPAGSGSGTLIAGFSVAGTTAKHVLIRGIGPGLIPYDVDGTLPDPVLTVYSGQTPIATNDNWSGDATLAAAFATVSAFALPNDTTDAALILTLAPGTYTVHVNDANGSGGVALVEVYEMP